MFIDLLHTGVSVFSRLNYSDLTDHSTAAVSFWFWLFLLHSSGFSPLPLILRLDVTRGNKLPEWRQGRQQSDFWAAIFSMSLYIVLVFYTTPWTQVHLVIYYELPKTFQKSCQTCLCPSCIYVADCSWKNVIACTSTKCITSVNFFRPSFQPIYIIFFTVCSANLMQKDCIQNNK